MKKVILIASVAVISVLASCGSKTNCVCTFQGQEILNQDLSTGAYSSLSASQRETVCSQVGSGASASTPGVSCTLK